MPGFINKNLTVCLIMLLMAFPPCTLILASAADYPADIPHDKEKSSEFNANEFIIDHIKDSHEWHIYTDKHGHHVSVYLPVILYSRHSGFHLFMSGKISHGHEYKGFRIMEKGEYAGSIVEFNGQGEVIGKPLDFSVTKNVIGMLVVALFMFLVFIRMGKVYKREGVRIPKGINSVLEPLVIFIRDNIALSNIGEKNHEKFVPFLLSIFFFIFINNLFGLIPFFPFGANITGNISVTLSLAVFTMLVTNIHGNRNYWKHIFATPGIPFWLLPLMIPVEVIGIFTKPFALMIRLFANVTAGHIIMLSLVSLIFIFKSLSVAPISLIMVLFMNFLELLVAFLQSYVFTLLSALFIGLAVKEDHH